MSCLCLVPKRVARTKKEDHSYAPDEADAEAEGRPVSMLNEASPELVGNAPEAEPLPVGKPAPLPLPLGKPEAPPSPP